MARRTVSSKSMATRGTSSKAMAVGGKKKTKKKVVKKTNPLDVQVGGGHYKDFEIQPIEFSHLNRLNSCETNIIKYACRHQAKGGAEDVKKIIHYAQLLLKLEYGEDV